jgi:uncharacterized damage-inducible protein DinB
MSRMLEMLRDLVAHKGHANAAMLSAIGRHGPAAADPAVIALLHHVLLANRFWLLTVQGRPFVHEHEARPAASFDDLVQRYAATQAEEAVWLETATQTELARVLEHPHIPGGACSVGQAFMQVCLHSHGHRAQCATLLRGHGAEPPTTDFILWLANRPDAAWPGRARARP